jgi:hypothetical protein
MSLATVEADVMAFIQKVDAGAEVLIADLEAAGNWIAANIATIDADLQTALGFATAVGGSNATVAQIIADANVSVTALNAYASSINRGGAQISSVIAGYQAITGAAAAAATVKAAATSAVAANPNATQVVSPPTPNAG